MRRASSLLASCCLGLAACGSSGGDTTGGGDGGANARASAAAAEFRMTPGQYRSTVTVTKFTAEGLPPQMAQMMGQARSFDYCITPEQAAGGIEAVKRQMAEGNCTYERFNAAGGAVDAVFSCSSAPGMTLRASSKGTYSDSGSNVAVVADMTMPGGKAIHMEQTVSAERIGDCTK